MYSPSQSLCFTGVNCYCSTGYKQCSIFQTYLTTEHSFCGTLIIFSNTCSGDSLGDVIVSYLFLNFLLARILKRYVHIQLLLVLIPALSQMTKISCRIGFRLPRGQTLSFPHSIAAITHSLDLISPSNATATPGPGQVPRAFQAHATPR